MLLPADPPEGQLEEDLEVGLGVVLEVAVARSSAVALMPEVFAEMAKAHTGSGCTETGEGRCYEVVAFRLGERKVESREQEHIGLTRDLWRVAAGTAKHLGVPLVVVEERSRLAAEERTG